MAPVYEFHGHAIVSDDDRIADADGRMPGGLTHAADRARFRRELDRAGAVILGRHGHVAHPNSRRRKRVVVSSSVRGIEQRTDGWWWNPATASLAEILTQALPGGGIVAVPGGRRVFDLFLDLYDEFHLVRARGVRIPDGIPVFSECAEGSSAEEVLGTHGMIAGDADILDSAAGLTVTVWTRPNSR